MSSLPRIAVTLQGHVVFLLLLLLALWVFTLLVYRKTNPVVSPALRYALLALRALALTIAVFILFEPILSLTLKRKQKVEIGVLIDTSASMSLADDGTVRGDRVRQLLKDPVWKELAKGHDLRFYVFSDQATPWTPGRWDSLEFRGDGTDIQKTLQEVKDQNAERYLASVILISDGGDNLGENPARYASNYGLPIHVIGIGSPVEQKDLLIANVITNPVTYAKNRVPVDITVKASGYEGQKVPVQLKQEGKVMASGTVTLAASPFEKTLRLYIVPEQEGLIPYEAAVPVLEGELTKFNNRKSFYVKVLKSKTKVLLLAGGPSPDLAFLKRAIMADENVEVISYTEKKAGQFYPGQPPLTPELMKQIDVVVLLDYPRSDSNPQALGVIKAALDQQSKPLLLFYSKDVSPAKLRAIETHLPVSLRGTGDTERLVYLRLTSSGANHAVMHVSDDAIENQTQWHDLPPIFYSPNSAQPLPGSETLAMVDFPRSGLPTLSREQPLVVVRSVGNQKSMAILGYGLWRWDLLLWGAGKTNAVYTRFITNALRWLTTEEEKKLVRIRPDKEIYRSGEEVRFIGQVFNADYQPLDNAEVTVQVQSKGLPSRGGARSEVMLEGVGEGRYEGRFQAVAPGEYQFSGTAKLKDRALGSDAGKFSVEEFRIEFQDTRMREDLLKAIAAQSGGKYYTPEQVGDLAKDIHFEPQVVVQSRETELWNKAPLLVAFIVLLSVEWFLRKRKGMV